MPASYSNLPVVKNNSFGQTTFVNFFATQIEVNVSTLDAMVGFFTSRGFETQSAESIVAVLLYQANKDNVNPLTFLDLLKGYTDIQLNSLMAEIINFNRYKTSYLGFGPIFVENNNVSRNILP